MGGVALNLAADREPVLWLPALLAVALRRARLGLARAARRARALGRRWPRCRAGFLSMGLRTARVETPVLDHIRIVKLQGFVEEVDLRPVGARLVLAVVDAGDMPADLAPRRVRVTTRKAPNVAAGDYVALQARLLPPSRAVLPGGYDFSRDAYFAGVGAVGSTLGAITSCRRRARRLVAPALLRGDRSGAQSPRACASTRSSAATRAPSPRRW